MAEKKVNKKMMDFIYDLYKQKYENQGKSIKDFTDDISLYSDGKNPPSERTVRRWLNGEVEPLGENLNLLANVFKVSKAELIEGERLDFIVLKNENNELQKQNSYAQLSHSLSRIDDSELPMAISIFLLASIIFYNQSTIKNILITAIAFITFVVINLNDFFAFNEEIKEMKSYNPDFSIRKLLRKVIELCKASEMVQTSIKQYILIVVTLSLLPLIETCFYKGTFFISGTVCLILALIMVTIKRSRSKK